MAIRLSARAVLIHDSKILLNRMGDGVSYNFPGGQIEENETAPEAVARELLEETGYFVEVGEYIFTCEYEPTRCGYAEGDCHRMHLFFRCALKQGTAAAAPFHPDSDPQDPSMKSQPAWVPLPALKTIPFVPSAIRDALIAYIETGVFRPLYFACGKPSA